MKLLKKVFKPRIVHPNQLIRRAILTTFKGRNKPDVRASI
jgi:hypothetical protein